MKNKYKITDFFTDEELEDISEEWCPSGWVVNCEDIDLAECGLCWTKYLKREIRIMVKEGKTFDDIEKRFAEFKSWGVANTDRNSSG